MKPYTPVKLRIKTPWYELIQKKTGFDPRICKSCKQGIMQPVGSAVSVTPERHTCMNRKE